MESANVVSCGQTNLFDPIAGIIIAHGDNVAGIIYADGAVLPIAKALKVSVEELLGIKRLKIQRDPKLAALWRQLKKVEVLPKKDQKALLHYLDVLVKKNGGISTSEG